MSISDNSGVTSTRPASTDRATSTRGDSTTARYQDLNAGGSGGTSSPGADPQPPKDQSGLDPEDPGLRPCAKVIWWEEWHTAEDERVCPECSPLDKRWYEQGKGPVPPLHDNCRCERVLVWWDCYQSDGTWEKGGRPQ